MRVSNETAIILLSYAVPLLVVAFGTRKAWNGQIIVGTVITVVGVLLVGMVHSLTQMYG